jgi:ectoine hydroxylase-related dioxygenase (phytanoyl-CoA dioxygenase family)
MKPATLQESQFQSYPEQGYVWPLRAFTDAEAEVVRQRFMEYWNRNMGRFEGSLPRERIWLTIDTHLALPWVCELALHPVVLDAVERVLGPDVLVWNTHWFPKFPGDRSYVSWHQDASYWGLRPPQVTTAWIALSPSTCENGCLQVLPGSHLGELMPQTETYAVDNMLSRGQEITVEIDPAQTLSLELEPGEFSLHHIGIAHGSGANESDIPRIGLAVRYIAPQVEQAGPHRDLAMLARGEDRHGHFDLVAAPDREWGLDEESLQRQSLQRKLDNNATRGSTLK